jgi:hypothetical protein
LFRLFEAISIRNMRNSVYLKFWVPLNQISIRQNQIFKLREVSRGQYFVKI